ncbi:Ig-like domain-containing protein, partial [Hyphomonas sp.]|uniref:Ig-like domain-containing protein n=1 Tax=Hyphomonas sp. TaxID=87 RepID=UPI0025C6F4D9
MTYPSGAAITYVYDAAGNRTAVQIAAPVNQPPVAVGDATSTNSNTAKSLDPRTNDSDPESGALTIVSVTTPSSGTAVVTGGGTGVTYTPAANFIGTATFNYTIRDPENATATATVTVAVNNQGPVAANDTTSTNSNTAKSLDPRTNDSDPEGGALTIVSLTTPSSGSAVVTGGGTGVTYTPAANFIGTATFSYTVRDPQNATATATVTVTVNNQGPVAVNDATSTNSNTAKSLDPRTN